MAIERDREQHAPSIGSVEINFDSNGNRVRQILSHAIDDPGRLISSLVEARSYAGERGATRVVVRGLTNSTILPELKRELAPTGYQMEAVVPLSGRYEGYNWTYYSWNDPARNSAPEVVASEKRLIQSIFERGQATDMSRVIERLTRSYSMERLSGELTPSDLARLEEMYRLSFDSYPFDIQASIEGMVRDITAQVYAARSRKDGMLYAVCATEEVSIDSPNGSRFRMREMGDSARIPTVNGLNFPLKVRLIQQAAYDGLDLVFCESRAALTAVNSVNQAAGMDHCGLLIKHTVISGAQDVDEVELDGESNGRYGNLNVWALNQGRIVSVSNQYDKSRAEE